MHGIQKPTETEKIVEIIIAGARSTMTSRQVIAMEVNEWMSGPARKMMLAGEQYYLNRSDIQKKARKYADGTEIKNRQNARLEHAFLRKIVDQKTGFLLTKPPSVSTEHKKYADLLHGVFTSSFWRMFKTAGREAINKGIAWLHVYYSETGEFKIKLIPSEQVIPFWADNAHTELLGLVRIYDIEFYEGRRKTRQRKIEYWSTDGVEYLTEYKGDLIDDVTMGDENGAAITYHFKMNGNPYNWERVPFIPVKYNDVEQPILELVKSLVDNYNLQTSVNADLLSDLPSAFLKLIGYGGANLDEFVRDIRQVNAVKLDAGGDVKHDTIDPNTQALEVVLKQTRKAIFEFGRAVDNTNEEISTPSGVALKFRYADLDMDCNIFESEVQASLEQLLWFVNKHLLNSGAGDFEREDVSIVLNRDIIISEADVITDCKNSVGIVSRRTIVANHPYTRDVDAELEALAEEEQETQQRFEDQYGGLANRLPQNPPERGVTDDGQS